MNIIFTDEQTASINGLNFTLVSAFRIPAAELPGLREDVYKRLTVTLDLISDGGGNKIIKPMPILHGSDLLRDYPDNKKLEALAEVFDAINSTSGAFFRIGYFDDSAGFVNREQRSIFLKSACYFGLWADVWKQDSSAAILVTEFDKRDMVKLFRSSTSDIGNYYCVDQKNISLPLAKVIGHYFALKDEIGCQIADLAAYSALKSMSRGSDFHQAAGEMFLKIKDRFILDRIIWWNDDSRSIVRV